MAARRERRKVEVQYNGAGEPEKIFVQWRIVTTEGRQSTSARRSLERSYASLTSQEKADLDAFLTAAWADVDTVDPLA